MVIKQLLISFIYMQYNKVHFLKHQIKENIFLSEMKKIVKK